MKFKYKGGALTCDTEIIGLTQELKAKDSIDYYGNKYFICESVTYSQAQTLASALTYFMNRQTNDYEAVIVAKE